jgi:hypothetical protein
MQFRMNIGAFHLLVEGGHGFRQKAGKAKRFSLLGGECITFIQKKNTDQSANNVVTMGQVEAALAFCERGQKASPCAQYR